MLNGKMENMNVLVIKQANSKQPFSIFFLPPLVAQVNLVIMSVPALLCQNSCSRLGAM